MELMKKSSKICWMNRKDKPMDERKRELEAVWERLVMAIALCKWAVKNEPHIDFEPVDVLDMLEKILEG